jgi:hypothetical protein
VTEHNSAVFFVSEYLMDNGFDLRQVINAYPSESYSAICSGLGLDGLKWFGHRLGFDSLQPILPHLPFPQIKESIERNFPLLYGLDLNLSSHPALNKLDDQSRFELPFVFESFETLFNGFVEAVHDYVQLFFSLSQFLQIDSLTTDRSLSDLVGSYLFRQDQLDRYRKSQSSATTTAAVIQQKK